MAIEIHDDVVALKRIGCIVAHVLQRMLDKAELGMTEEAAHRGPGERFIRAGGDALNVEVSAELSGCFADTGGKTIVPPTAQETRPCHATRTRSPRR